MKRAVYIGGFINGKQLAEGVADALTVYYDAVDAFTFSNAMDIPNTIRRAVQGVDVFTHSAGMLALAGTNPNRIAAFGPPLPTTPLALVGRTVRKTVRMHTPGIGIQTRADVRAVGVYEAGAVAEVFAHPKGNFGRLGQVAAFNAVHAGIAAEQSGIPTSLVYFDGDEYFQLSAAQEAEAVGGGVHVQRIPGIHDELALRPEQTLRQVDIEQLL